MSFNVQKSKLSTGLSHSHFLAAVSECVHEAILILDEGGNVLYSNSAARDLFDVSLSDLDLGISLPPEKPVEIDFQCRDGSFKKLELRCLPQTEEEQAFFVVSVQDITNQKRLEAKLESLESDLNQQFHSELETQRTKFEEERKHLYFRLNENRFREKRLQDRIWHLEEETESLIQEKQELEMFGHIAGHDLKDSLRNLVMAAELLAQHPTVDKSEELLSYREMIRKHSQHLVELLRDIQTFTGIRNKSHEWSEFSMTEACEEAVRQLRLQLQEREAVVKISSLPWARANRGLIILVLQNLISNASKFTGGRLPEIEIFSGQNPGTGELFIAVKDNGIGIDPKYFDRLFQIFSRLVRRDEYAGSGLGLAICRKIVESHDGRIWVESNIGAGSTFFLSLPTFYSTPLEQKA